MKKKGLYVEKNVNLWLLSILSDAANRSNNRDCTLPAHLFLSYHLLYNLDRDALSRYNHLNFTPNTNYWSHYIISLVLILYGNSGMGAHLWSDLSYLICLRHLLRSRAVTKIDFCSPKRPIYLHTCAMCFEVLSNISTMIIRSSKLNVALVILFKVQFTQFI